MVLSLTLTSLMTLTPSISTITSNQMSGTCSTTLLSKMSNFIHAARYEEVRLMLLTIASTIFVILLIYTYVTITENTKTQVVCFGICFIALCALDY